MAERRRNKRQAEELAAQGRGKDTEVAHLAKGEFVVPKALQTPELLAALRKAAADQDIRLEAFLIGNTMNSVNPVTGAPEFGENSHDFGADENDPPHVPDLDIKIPGVTSASRSLPPGIGTAPLPYDPAPSYRPPEPGIGTLPLRPDSPSAYGPRLGPGMGTMPFVDNANSAEMSDFNPIKNYPVPGYTMLTPPKPEMHQGSGEFEAYRRNGKGKDSWHTGVDFAVPPGTEVFAPGDGVVVSATPIDGYGNQIAIRHGNGFTTQVAHIGSVMVKPGDKVIAGQVIGISGATGNAQGKDPQVHFEVRGGKWIPSRKWRDNIQSQCLSSAEVIRIWREPAFIAHAVASHL